MGRTRRAAIDGGFDTSGNEWSFDSGSFVSFPIEGYVQFDLPFLISLDDSNSISTLTLWSNGVLSLGPPTQEQIDFFASGASPIPSEGAPGFPGEFFIFDFVEGSQYSSYSFGIGIADYDAPFDRGDAVDAAFFSFDNGFQFIIDRSGFTILDENGNFDATNGFFIGGLSEQNLGFGTEYEFGFPDFFTYNGTGEADSILGTAYDERFLSSAGADSIDGLTGVDTVSYLASAGGVTVNLQTNVNSGGDAEADQLFNIERVEGSAFADTLTGDDAGNYLFGHTGIDTVKGGDGDDVIDGGAGADILDGGTGRDTLSYESSLIGVSVSLQDLTATGGDAEGDSIQGFERLVGSNFDDFLQGSVTARSLSGLSGDDTLVGSSAADSLVGGSGDDFLVGGGGADDLDGEFGLDTVSYVDSAEGVVVNLENSSASGGDATGDRLFSIENLVGTAFADTMVGNFFDNRMEGGAASDVLYGRGGNDVLLGGMGSDQLHGEDGSDTLYGGDNNDVLKGGAGLDVLIGGAGLDTLSGGAGTDILAGDSGNDILEGGTGADTMSGGFGDDLFYVDNLADIVIEGASGGNDRVLTSVTYVLNVDAQVEELATTKATGTANINLTGNRFDNAIVGNAGANVLNGGLGADTLDGGLGNDTYIVDNAFDVVREASDIGGLDTVLASIGFSLGKNVENLTLVGNAAINGSGNDLNNVLIGNDAANVLKGGSGRDTLIGGAGDDVLNGGLHADTMTGGLGNDTYYVGTHVGDVLNEDDPAGGIDSVISERSWSLGANFENLTLVGADPINGGGNDLNNVLIGNSASNTLKGGNGKDTLFGGLGADVLSGGAGQDKFFFDTALGGANIDQMIDFSVADDTIYLDQSIFTQLSPGLLANDAFRLGTSAADADDRIIYDSTTGSIWYDADGSGAGAAIHFADVTPGTALANFDFFVVS